MKIAISTKFYFPLQGGSIVYAMMLAKAFSMKGHEVKLPTRTPGEPVDHQQFPVIRNPSRKEHFEIAKWSDVLLQVDSSWRDVYPFLWYRKPWFPTIHRGSFGKRGLGILARFKFFAENLAYRIGNTIAVSNFAKQSWGLECTVIPNPYDDSIFNQGKEAVHRDIDLLFVGRMSRDKGIFILVDAISGLREAPKRVAFIGGGVDLNTLKEESNRLIPDVKCDFPGSLRPEEVAFWMRRSRVLVFPTTPDWLEASPLTPLEAAACGCTIIASDIGGTLENLPPGHFTCTPGCIQSLQDTLSAALIRDQSTIATGTRKFLDARTLNSTAKFYLSIFENTLSRNGVA